MVVVKKKESFSLARARKSQKKFCFVLFFRLSNCCVSKKLVFSHQTTPNQKKQISLNFFSFLSSLFSLFSLSALQRVLFFSSSCSSSSFKSFSFSFSLSFGASLVSPSTTTRQKNKRRTRWKKSTMEEPN